MSGPGEKLKKSLLFLRTLEAVRALTSIGTGITEEVTMRSTMSERWMVIAPAVLLAGAGLEGADLVASIDQPHETTLSTAADACSGLLVDSGQCRLHLEVGQKKL
jgi:hypothetical protein